MDWNQRLTSRLGRLSFLATGPFNLRVERWAMADVVEVVYETDHQKVVAASRSVFGLV